MSAIQAAHSLHSVYDSGVYAIVAPMGNGQSVVKIGRTVDPVARFAQLLPGIPFRCKMYYLSVGFSQQCSRVEANLHRQFKSRRTRGEWFLFSDDERDLLVGALETEHKRMRPSVAFKLREISMQAVSERAAKLARNRASR